MIKTPSFWYNKDSVFGLALAPASFVYKTFSQKRIRKKPRYNSKIPVLCVGNITAGGSGKTPIVNALAKILKDHGKKPHILSRGYGGRIKNATRVNTDIHTAREVGDEPLMHAQNFPCWISPDRVKAARLIEKDGHSDIIIMDDGFQNPHLHKDINIIVVDGAVGFGNEKLLPAGPLREPVDDGIKRADALIIMGDDRHYLSERFSYLLPVFHGRLSPNFDVTPWQKKRVIGFTGIGRPEKFRQTVLSLGVKLMDFVPFADHHFFTLRDIQNLMALAKKHNAELITTEKDWGRLPHSYQSVIKPIPVTVKWKDEEVLLNFLKESGLL